MRIEADRWLERYQRGERAVVWHEMRQVGWAVREEPRLLKQARGVCDEMATRVVHNLEIVIARLTAAGIVFHHDDASKTPREPWQKPSADAAAFSEWLDEHFGIPLSLDSWIRTVGDVNLTGSFPVWQGAEGAGPLNLEVEGSGSRHAFLLEDRELWDADVPQNVEHPGPYILEMGGSAEGSYGLMLPDWTAEGTFVHEVPVPFVAYLNQVFHNGGYSHPTGAPHGIDVSDLGEGLLRL